MSKAPNYDGEFPEAGERMGPAWQYIWDQLESGKWVTGKTLAHSTELRPDTVYHMLKDASDKGVIERNAKPKPGKRTFYLTYRRTDSEVKKDDKSNSDVL